MLNFSELHSDKLPKMTGLILARTELGCISHYIIFRCWNVRHVVPGCKVLPIHIKTGYKSSVSTNSADCNSRQCVTRTFTSTQI